VTALPMSPDPFGLDRARKDPHIDRMSLSSARYIPDLVNMVTN